MEVTQKPRLTITEGAALWNSVGFCTEHYSVTVKRTPTGSIVVQHKKSCNSGNVGRMRCNIPFIRGFLILFRAYTGNKLMMILGIAWSLLSIDSLAHQAPITSPQTGKIVMVIAGCILLGVLIRLSPVARYHAAEHMTYRCFTSRFDLTIENVRQHSRVSSECGTNLLIYITSIASGLIVLQVPLILAVTAGFSIGYEMFLIEDDTILYRLLFPFRLIAFSVQRFFLTAPPSETEIEVAIHAIHRLEELEGMTSTDLREAIPWN